MTDNYNPNQIAKPDPNSTEPLPNWSSLIRQAEQTFSTQGMSPGAILDFLA